MLSVLYDSHHSVDFGVVFLWWSEIRKACQFGVNLRKRGGLIWNQTEKKNVSRRSAKWDWLLQLWKRVSKRHLPSAASAFKRWMLKRWILKRHIYQYVISGHFILSGVALPPCVFPLIGHLLQIWQLGGSESEKERFGSRKRFCLVVCFVAYMCTSVKFSVCLFIFASE